MRGFFILILLLSVQASAQNLKISSYNIRMNRANDGVNNWNLRKDKVNELIRYHDFDIVGVQEAFKDQLDDMLRMKEYAYTGSGREDGKSAGEHSAILYKTSRFKLLKSGDFWYSETPDVPGKGWDARCCNRICSWARFKDLVTKKEFYVFNSHFDHEGVEARRNSGKLLVAKMKEIAGKLPVIAMGDLNSTPDTEQVVYISQHYNDTFNASEMPPYGPIGTFNAFKYDAALKDRIDYIFVSEHFKVKKYATLTDSYQQKFPSDHLPVVVDLEIKK
ncbi:endonuclease/exonuclease/phosphatase family protein [Leadbetterella byssophila]|uniref:endonuclease/exonuclease/phosphatase family protein n=1 Tax=Leadbetterella byssophila TaxID=316068 RepID=UPI0039A1BF01